MERADDRLLFVENRNVFFYQNVSVDMIFIYVWNWMSAIAMWTCIQIAMKFDS